MLISSLASAQNKRPAPKKPDCRIPPRQGIVDPVRESQAKEKKLFDALSLTDAQKEKVRAIREKQGKKADKQREKARKQREKDLASYKKEMKKVLTPDQYARFEKILDARDAQRGKGRGHGQGYRGGQGGPDEPMPQHPCGVVLPDGVDECNPEGCHEEDCPGVGPIVKGPDPILMTE